MALKSKPSGGSTYPTEKSDEMLQTAFGFYRQRKSRCREGDGRWKNFSNCVEFSSAMPPRGRNKPSENKMQSHRERNNIDDEGEDHHHHLYKMTRWCLREPGHTASPSCLPCTAPITAPGSRPPFWRALSLQCQGQPRSEHWGVVNRQLFCSPVVNS